MIVTQEFLGGSIDILVIYCKLLIKKKISLRKKYYFC